MFLDQTLWTAPVSQAAHIAGNDALALVQHSHRDHRGIAAFVEADGELVFELSADQREMQPVVNDFKLNRRSDFDDISFVRQGAFSDPSPHHSSLVAGRPRRLCNSKQAEWFISRDAFIGVNRESFVPKTGASQP